jgi:hypothetical protein
MKGPHGMRVERLPLRHAPGRASPDMTFDRTKSAK